MQDELNLAEVRLENIVAGLEDASETLNTFVLNGGDSDDSVSEASELKLSEGFYHVKDALALLRHPEIEAAIGKLLKTHAHRQEPAAAGSQPDVGSVF